MKLRQEEFDKTVLEFTKALAVNDSASDAPSRIFDRAIKLAVAWHQDSAAREKAFENLNGDLDANVKTKKVPVIPAGKLSMP